MLCKLDQKLAAFWLEKFKNTAIVSPGEKYCLDRIWERQLLPPVTKLMVPRKMWLCV